jgi:hypothetical protein
MDEWFGEWNKNTNESNDLNQLTIEEVRYGLATEIKVFCPKFNLVKTVTEPKKATMCIKTMNNFCKYNINLHFCFALQLMGVGGEHAAIMTTFLDFLCPWKWSRQFNVLENFTSNAVQQVKECSQVVSVQDEMAETVAQESNYVEQDLLEQDLPLHHIQASYDIRWQVHSSGGKYGSPTGHGLLRGARSVTPVA